MEHVPPQRDRRRRLGLTKKKKKKLHAASGCTQAAHAARMQAGRHTLRRGIRPAACARRSAAAADRAPLREPAYEAGDAGPRGERRAGRTPPRQARRWFKQQRGRIAGAAPSRRTGRGAARRGACRGFAARRSARGLRRLQARGAMAAATHAASQRVFFATLRNALKHRARCLGSRARSRGRCWRECLRGCSREGDGSPHRDAMLVALWLGGAGRVVACHATDKPGLWGGLGAAVGGAL